MANFVFNTGAKEIADGTLDLVTDTIKVMLVGSAVTPTRDMDTVDQVNSDEIDATGYTAGFGGAGRKTLGNKAWAVDKTNDRAEFTASSVSWTGLGNATNDNVVHVILIKEITNDAGSRLIAHIDTSSGSPSLPFTTNGSDLTITFSAEGVIQLGTT